MERKPNSLPHSYPLPVGKLPLDLLSGLLSRRPVTDPSVLVGPGVGKDAAAIAIGDTVLVIKNDPVTFVSSDAALYLVSVNANDLACLGATPRWMLVTSLLPEGKTTVDSVAAQFSQLQTACAQHGIELIGGHTEVTAGLDRPMMVGMMIGEVERTRLLPPGGGRPGDRLVQIGPIAVEGTALVAKELRNELEARVGSTVTQRAARLLSDPGISIVREASILLDTGGVNALHDPTEGGIASGVRELAEASGCGVVMRRSLVAMLPETQAIADALELDPLGMLASGTLVAAVRPEALTQIDAVCQAHSLNASVIGKLTDPTLGFSLIEDDDHRVGLPFFVTDEVSRAVERFKERSSDNPTRKKKGT